MEMQMQFLGMPQWMLETMGIIVTDLTRRPYRASTAKNISLFGQRVEK
jgi:hypothetical protein